MRKLRAGIVGCGGIANGKHLPAMQKSGLYEVVAFCATYFHVIFLFEFLRWYRIYGSCGFRHGPNYAPRWS